jgi:hypothetical protein
MRAVYGWSLCLIFLAAGCGKSEPETPVGGGVPNVSPQPMGGAAPAAAVKLSFDNAMRDGKVVWQPVRNIQLTTKTPGGTNVQAFDFVTKLKYDGGNPSVDTTGQKSYHWPDREVVFGPEAVITVTQAITVTEGEIAAGDRWVWNGAAWVSQKSHDAELAKAEDRLLGELGNQAVSLVKRDPGAAVDESLNPVYARITESANDVRKAIAECRAEATCLPAVILLKEPPDAGEIVTRFGHYAENLDQTMLYPTSDGGQEGKPIHWYRYGRLDLGVDFARPVITAIRVRSG